MERKDKNNVPESSISIYMPADNAEKLTSERDKQDTLRKFNEKFAQLDEKQKKQLLLNITRAISTSTLPIRLLERFSADFGREPWKYIAIDKKQNIIGIVYDGPETFVTDGEPKRYIYEFAEPLTLPHPAS